MRPLQKYDFFMRLLFSHLPVNCWAVKWNRWSSKARNTSDDGVTWKLRPERWADGELALDSLVRDHSASHLIYATVSEMQPKPLILQHHQTAQTWLRLSSAGLNDNLSKRQLQSNWNAGNQKHPWCILAELSLVVALFPFWFLYTRTSQCFVDLESALS